MDAQRKKCIMYVDYESLPVGFSPFQYLNMDNLLADLLEKAYQRFQVQRAIVFGDWTNHANRNRLEDKGFICRPTTDTGTEVGREIQVSITESLDSNEAAEAYVLVSGRADHKLILRQLYLAGKESVLWVFVPPLSDDQSLCSSWELIIPPSTLELNSWPREVALHAVAVVADHLQSDNYAPFLISHLLEGLRKLEPYLTMPDIWLNIAVREQIILLQRSDDQFEMPYGLLNRQHAVVQKALVIRERILTTLGTMLANHDWVAFNTLEKALRIARPLSESQGFRHAWLELLVAEEVLIAKPVPQTDGSFMVTTLRLNQDHPIIAIEHRQEYLNLIRLIVIISDFTGRKSYPWMAVANLLKILTKATTRVEARATLSKAEEQGIVQLGTLPSPQNPEFAVATAQLNTIHPLVQEALTQRDRMILLTNSVLKQRRFVVSEPVLTEEIIAASQMKEDEVLFWIWLLVSEGLVGVEQISFGPKKTLNMIRLKLEDPLVKQILDQASRDDSEVKQ